jgi:hypothetical protein
MLVLPFFIWQAISHPEIYTLKLFLYTQWVWICLVIAISLLNYAFKTGKAAILLACDNLKTVWQVVAVGVIDVIIPNPLQIIGCIVGLAGVLVII